MKIEDLRIGQKVVSIVKFKYTERESIPMKIVGLFEDGTVYLDFEGNEGDVWEDNVENIKPVK